MFPIYELICPQKFSLATVSYRECTRVSASLPPPSMFVFRKGGWRVGDKFDPKASSMPSEVWGDATKDSAMVFAPFTRAQGDLRVPLDMALVTCAEGEAIENSRGRESYIDVNSAPNGILSFGNWRRYANKVVNTKLIYPASSWTAIVTRTCGMMGMMMKSLALCVTNHDFPPIYPKKSISWNCHVVNGFTSTWQSTMDVVCHKSRRWWVVKLRGDDLYWYTLHSYKFNARYEEKFHNCVLICAGLTPHPTKHPRLTILFSVFEVILLVTKPRAGSLATLHLIEIKDPN